MLRLLRRAAWSAAIAACFVVVAILGGWLVTDGPMGRAVSDGPQSPGIGGPFTLVDHHGRTVTERYFRGRPMAIFFGFTWCADVCPTTLGDMTRMMDELGEAADRVHWVFVSVDAGRDRPETMAAYLTAFDPRIVGLSGNDDQIAQAAGSFRVHYRRVPLSEGGYTMDHSASVFLLDADGQFAGTLDHKESDEVALAKLRTLLSTRR